MKKLDVSLVGGIYVLKETKYRLIGINREYWGDGSDSAVLQRVSKSRPFPSFRVHPEELVSGFKLLGG